MGDYTIRVRRVSRRKFFWTVTGPLSTVHREPSMPFDLGSGFAWTAERAERKARRVVEAERRARAFSHAAGHVAEAAS